MLLAWTFATLSALLLQSAPPPQSVPALNLTIGRDTNLLVIAPHPDDEALGAAGLIQRVRAAGGSVRVVLMTSGDAFPEGVEAERHIRRPGPKDYRDYGNLRERETIAAMEQLGVHRSHLLFLGFPDEGLCYIASTRGVAKARVYKSSYTQRVEPPSADQVVRGVEYRDSDVRRELAAILKAYRPTIIAVATPDDDHPDHGATGILVQEAVDAVRAERGGSPKPQVLEYLVHHDRWPDLKESVDMPLEPPADLPLLTGQWRSFALSDREVARKRQVLERYPSQQLVLAPFLKAFGRPNELFIVGRADKRSECWCDATHVATGAAVEAVPRRHRHAVRKS